MSKQDFPHRENGPPQKGLLERAADMFDFSGALKGRNLPPIELTADLIAPPPAPVDPTPAIVAAPEIAQNNAPAPAPAAPAAPRARDWTGPEQPLDRVLMAESGFLVPGAAVTGLGEEFRIVKRELMAGIRGKREGGAIPNGNVILMTSAHPGDGKTFCSINLALSLAAENDLEVLLVDADFAQPGIPQALGLPEGKGLMDALVDPSLAIEDLVIRTDMPSLSVLPAGGSSRHDAEYLASSRTDAVIAALVSGRPDRVVIFDSPPLLAASAASVLAAHVGQTILVVRADRTTETALRDAASLLNGCPHIQLLLNGVKFSASGRRFGTYYGKEH